MNLLHLTIHTEPDSPSLSRVELDGEDISSKLVSVELTGTAGSFFRANLGLVCTVDVDTRALLETHTAQTREYDNAEAERRAIQHSFDVVRNALLVADAPLDAYTRLAELEHQSLDRVLPDTIADVTPLSASVREYAVVKDGAE